MLHTTIDSISSPWTLFYVFFVYKIYRPISENKTPMSDPGIE